MRCSIPELLDAALFKEFIIYGIFQGYVNLVAWKLQTMLFGVKCWHYMVYFSSYFISPYLKRQFSCSFSNYLQKGKVVLWLIKRNFLYLLCNIAIYRLRNYILKTITYLTFISFTQFWWHNWIKKAQNWLATESFQSERDWLEEEYV